jgi:hypothetical protein
MWRAGTGSSGRSSSRRARRRCTTTDGTRPTPSRTRLRRGRACCIPATCSSCLTGPSTSPLCARALSGRGANDTGSPRSSGPYPAAPISIFTPFNASEALLSLEAHSYWTSFARNFNPSSARLDGAPKWETAREGRLLIKEGTEKRTMSGMEDVAGVHEERCRFWNEVGAEIGL